MRISELVVGGVYTWKNGGTRHCDWYVCVLLDTRPWVSDFGRPRPAEPDERIRRVRSVPIADLEPMVTLADGSDYQLPFGPHLHVFAGGGWSRRDVDPARLRAVAIPRLVSISDIARRVG